MDKAIKWSSVVAVALLAAVAGWISYTHALDVVRVYHVPSPERYAYPVTVDGIIYSASMLLLYLARSGERIKHTRTYAWAVLGLGVGVTGAVNAWAGLPYGVGGAITYAWPAVALVLSYEGLMLLIRNMAETPETQAPRSELHAFGGVPSIRQIMRDEQVGFPKAKARLKTLLNGSPR